MKIDAIGVASSDFERSSRFYSLLGFEFPSFEPGEKHIEAKTAPGATRLMIDDSSLMAEIMGVGPRPPSHSSFALLCEDAAEVNEAAARVGAAGFKVIKQPWDAFWGQRYAVVADPDGYMIDLFAWLPGAA